MISKFVRASVAVAVLLAQGRTLASAQAMPVSTVVWCSHYDLKNFASFAPAQTVEKAEESLCNGQFRQANDQFATVLAYWREHQYDAGWWIDTARGYFYSLIAEGDDAKARNFLSGLEAEQTPKWQPREGDRLFWSGDPKAAFQKYATEVGDLSNLPDSAAVPAKNVSDAAQATGAWDSVVAILSRPADSAGASTITSLQLLMLGNALEVERDWLPAFSAWVRAANNGHQVPEFDSFDDWNLSALEMIYFYRAHIPRGQRL